VRNAYRDPRHPDRCDTRPRDSTARTAGQGDDPGPETEEQLEDVREWQIRIDPRRVVLAQLDDVGKTREPLEPAAVLVRVAEDLWADIRVENDASSTGFAVEQRHVRARRRIERERERADMDRPGVLGQRRQQLGRKIGERG